MDVNARANGAYRRTINDSYEDILGRFQSTGEFFKFARSSRGLSIEQRYIKAAQENYPKDVEQQKLDVFHLWLQKQGHLATIENFERLVWSYFNSEDNHLTENSEALNAAQPEINRPEQNSGSNIIFERSVRAGAVVDECRDVEVTSQIPEHREREHEPPTQPRQATDENPRRRKGRANVVFKEEVQIGVIITRSQKVNLNISNDVRNVADNGNQDEVEVQRDQIRPNVEGRGDQNQQNTDDIGDQNQPNSEDIGDQTLLNIEDTGDQNIPNLACRIDETRLSEEKESDKRSDPDMVDLENKNGSNIKTRGDQNRAMQTRLLDRVEDGTEHSGSNMMNTDNITGVNTQPRAGESELNMENGDGDTGFKVKLNAARANEGDGLKQQNAADGDGQNGLEMNDIANENVLPTENASGANMDGNMDILNPDQGPEVEGEQNVTKMDDRKHQNGEQLPDIIMQCEDKSSPSGAGVHDGYTTTTLHDQVDEGGNETMCGSETDACDNTVPNVEGNEQSVTTPTEGLHQTDEMVGDEVRTIEKATTANGGQERETTEEPGFEEFSDRFARSKIICGVIIIILAFTFVAYRQRTKTT